MRRRAIKGETIRTCILIERWKADLIKAMHIDYAFVFDRGFDDILRTGENRITRDFLTHRREEKVHARDLLVADIKMIDSLIVKKGKGALVEPKMEKEEIPVHQPTHSIANAILAVFRNDGKDITEGASEVSDLIGRTVTTEECRIELIKMGILQEGAP